MCAVYTSPPVSPSPDEAFRRRGGICYYTIFPLCPPPLGKEGEVCGREDDVPPGRLGRR